MELTEIKRETNEWMGEIIQIYIQVTKALQPIQKPLQQLRWPNYGIQSEREEGNTVSKLQKCLDYANYFFEYVKYGSRATLKTSGLSA